MRRLLEAADRAWWSRTIARAQIVDLEYTRAQGYRGTARAAVRHYVRGGFRAGFGLNPLFMEQIVAMQLSDAGRVPALYAYLVNPMETVRTSSLWDAPAYARAHPHSLQVPGGPVGHAWRHMNAGGTLPFGPPGSAVEIARTDLAAVIARAGTGSRSATTPPTRAFDTQSVVVCVVGPREGDIAAAITSCLAAADELRAHLVFALQNDRSEAWMGTAGLIPGRPATSVVRTGPTNDDVSRVIAQVESAAARGAVLVVRGPHSEVSAEDLVALAHSAITHRVAPLWLDEDGTVASAGTYFHGGRAHQLLRGHAADDARALGAVVDVPEIAGSTYALPVDITAPSRTLTTLSVRTYDLAPGPPARSANADDTDLNALLAPAGLAVQEWVDGEPLLRVTHEASAVGRASAPRLRWAIKTAAPAGLAAEWWGDTHFARGLADALRRLGQHVVIDGYAAVDRPSRHLDDVVLALRGPRSLRPQPGATSLLWIISHPDEITRAELEGFDRVFAASESWAAQAATRFGVDIAPLLQCTDAHRFRPQGLARSADIVFVGTARGIARPSVVEPIRAGVPVSVYGPDWTGYIPASSVAASGISNAALPRLYETASVVLNDHWPAMQQSGFVSNRLFDVVAAGGRAISDEVEGIDELFSGAVVTYRSIPELLGYLRGDLDTLFPSAERIREISAKIRSEHSFDARARTLLEDALARP